MGYSEPFSLADYSALLDDAGIGSLLRLGGGPPPSPDGLTIGLVELTRPPPHAGERHMAGDELIILIAGDISIILEEELVREVRLRPGEAFIVPRGVWHRLLIHGPTRLAHATPGGKEIRPLPDGSDTGS